MGSRILAVLVLLLAVSVAHAKGYKAKQDVEASMLVTGTIEVDPQGRVERYGIDQPEALPVHVTRLLARAVPHWEFEPFLHDGKPASVRTSMRIRVVANELAGEEIVLRIAGASFGDDKLLDDSQPGKRLAPPRYPGDALRSGVTATVYLLGRVGLDGSMQEVIAEQVNMRYLGPARIMDELRDAFAQESIRAALTWTFATPEDVLASGKPHWSVRVPVDFTLDDMRTPDYGKWDSYVAGPHQTAWWVEEEERPQRADTFAGGGFYPVGKGLKLLTSLDTQG